MSNHSMDIKDKYRKEEVQNKFGFITKIRNKLKKEKIQLKVNVF